MGAAAATAAALRSVDDSSRLTTPPAAAEAAAAADVACSFAAAAQLLLLLSLLVVATIRTRKVFCWHASRPCHASVVAERECVCASLLRAVALIDSGSSSGNAASIDMTTATASRGKGVVRNATPGVSQGGTADSGRGERSGRASPLDRAAVTVRPLDATTPPLISIIDHSCTHTAHPARSGCTTGRGKRQREKKKMRSKSGAKVTHSPPSSSPRRRRQQAQQPAEALQIQGDKERAGNDD